MSFKLRWHDIKYAWSDVRRAFSLPKLRWPFMLRRTHDRLIEETNQRWFQVVLKARAATNRLPRIKQEWLDQGVILEHLEDDPHTGRRHRFSLRKKT